jgi:hypothetical protein
VNPSARRLSQWLGEPMPLRKVADLLGVDAAKACGLVRAGRFPCRVTKEKGKYVVLPADVLVAMGSMIRSCGSSTCWPEPSSRGDGTEGWPPPGRVRHRRAGRANVPPSGVTPAWNGLVGRM